MKKSITSIQKTLWLLCKEITRKQWGNVCYTCGAVGLEGGNWQTGHMWPKSTLGATMKYDLRILRPQCHRCNCHHGGEGARYYVRMLAEIGKKKMKVLEFDRDESRRVSIKAYDHYVKLVEDYKVILRKL